MKVDNKKSSSMLPKNAMGYIINQSSNFHELKHPEICVDKIEKLKNMDNLGPETHLDLQKPILRSKSLAKRSK